MRSYVNRSVGLLAVAVAVATVISCAGENGESASAVAIDADDIGGVVTSAQGPEAGVWVVAETQSLPTPFARMVVTDDQGQYVLPDLPDASYEVFVRGYGLVDSARVQAMPGQTLDLDAVVAPDAAAAAEIYPAAYWLATMDQDLAGCALACHQMGTKRTREIPENITSTTASSLEAWDKRTAAGPMGQGMGAGFLRLGEERQAFADWTDRIANGEIPDQVPPRPAGVERNVVVSVWDWGTKFDGRTDAVASDLRDANVNANGHVYMTSRSSDILAVLDPVEHRAWNLEVPSTAPESGDPSPWSPYFGDDPVWKRNAEPRSLAMDGEGRVWMTAILRESPRDHPEFCTSDTNKFAQYSPARAGGGNGRQLLVYNPQGEEFTPIVDTCFSLDHNQMGPGNQLWFGGRNTVFWMDTDTWDETQDAEASQGWCPAVVDTNADGVITEWTEPDEAIDPAKDHRVEFGCYQIAVDPNDPDGVAWCGEATKLTRVERGPNPPETCKAEVYRPPTGAMPEVSGAGHAAVDGDGVVWMNWRGSQHFTSFDHRQCTVTNGPEVVDGQTCPQGWSLHRKSGPTYPGSNAIADMTYLSQIDRHNALGLGADLPMYGPVNSDSLVAFQPDSEEFVNLVVPYPLGFFSRSANGRIDDASTGWKGKGVWSSFSTYTPWHVEGGDKNGSKAVKFQMRPDPLAK